jgi:hypothetical protein
MKPQQIYITVTIAVAVVVIVLVALIALLAGRGKKGKALTALTCLAMAFVLAGILFGGNRLVGYGLMGIGVLLTVVDLVRKVGNKTVESQPQA